MCLVDFPKGVYLAALRAFAGLRCFWGDVYSIAVFLEDFYDFFSKIVAKVKVFLKSL
mgnify:CR=1 FL=1